MMISFACPNCRGMLTVPSERARERGPCPHCRAPIQMPAPEPPTFSNEAATIVLPETNPAHAATVVASEFQRGHARVEPSSPETTTSTMERPELRSEVESARRDPQKIFGRFVLLGELGKGGMGIVYRAWDDRLRRVVALKTILPGQGTEAAIKRFHREAEAVARLKHPNIVTVYEAGEIDGKHYQSMEFIEGTTLSHRLKPAKHDARQRIPLTKALEALRDVARAVDYAHEQGVVHRDLKPQNVILDRSDHPFVLDFGLAQIRDSETKLTKTGDVMGTLAYMPPEQAGDSSQKIDRRSDVYALGATLYHVLTGRPPFEGSSQTVLYAVLMQEPVPPGSMNRRAGGDLETICLTCLRKDPAKRYQTAGQLADELERYLAGDTIVAQPMGSVARLVGRAKRNKLASAFAILIVALFIVGSVVLAGASAKARAAIVEQAREEAERKFGAARTQGGGEGRDRLARALDAFDSGTQWTALAPRDEGARALQFEAALALGDTAADAEQWSLADYAFAKAEELHADDAKARAASKAARERVDARHGEAVKKAIDRARKGGLAEDEDYQAELHVLTGLRERQTVALLGKVIDEVANKLEAAHARPSDERTLTPEDETTLRLACEALGRIKIIEPAIGPLERYLKIEDDEVRAVQAAIALCRIGGDEAERVVTEARSRFGLDGAFWGQLGSAYKRAKFGTRLASESADAYFQRAGSRLQKKDLDGAIADYTRAIDLSPRLAVAFSNRGEAHRQKHDLDASLADLTRAIELEPSFANAWQNRASTKMDLKDLEGAIVDFTRAIELNRALAVAWHGRGLARERKGDSEGALADYARAIELKPRDDLFWAERGEALLQKDDLGCALVHLRRATEIDPKNAQTWNDIGVVKKKLEDFDGAIDAYTRAIEADSRYADAFINRAKARRHKNDREGVRADLKRCLELAPDGPHAQEAREALEALKGP